MNIIPTNSHHFGHPFQKGMLGKLWEPVTIGSLEMKNRIAMAPIQALPAEDVWPDLHPTHIAFHEAVAKGGAGLIVIGECDVTPDSKGTVQVATEGQRRRTKGIWSDASVPGWRKLIDACHRWDTRVTPQLSSYADWRPRTSAVRKGGEMTLIVPSWQEIGMTPKRLEEEKENFVKAALRVKEAGGDGVQIAGTRESLVASLVSPLRNPGTPGYSEGLTERVRFPVEVIRAIKQACGDDFPVLIRISAVEYFTGGYDIDYAKLVAEAYAEAGIDAIDVVQAGYSTQLPQLQMIAPPGLYAHNARVVKDHLAQTGHGNVTIMNACRIQNPWLAAELVRNGDCDVVSICRQLMIDPDWPNKIKENRLDDIIPCIGCGWCLRHHTCAVNPKSPFYKSVELNKVLEVRQTDNPKKVLVVGGGMTGLEAARAAAERGHQVTLYEKESGPGRRIFAQSRAPFREDMDLLRQYLVSQIEKLGVEVRCGVEVTAEMIEREQADEVVIATGCKPVHPIIPGLRDHPNVVFAEDVLLGNTDIGENVVVIDADYQQDYCGIGSFTAEHVARNACVRDDIAMHIMRWSPQHSPAEAAKMSDTPVGREVTIITRQDRICDVEYHHYTTVADLKRLGVVTYTDCSYKRVTPDGVVIEKDGKELFLKADTIITACYEPEDSLYRELKGKVKGLHLVGNARGVQVDFIGNIHSAYRLALMM